MTPTQLRERLALATADPGQFAGFKANRTMGQWMADAVIEALPGIANLCHAEFETPYNDTAPEPDEKQAVIHLGRTWWAVRLGSQWFARDPRGNDTGPYGSAQEARDWIKVIRP